jgi:hypothetical protein
MSISDAALRQVSDWDDLVTMLQAWDHGLPRHDQHPIRYRLRAARHLLEAIQACGHDDSVTASTTIRQVMRAIERWAKIAHRDPTSGTLRDDDPEDYLAVIADICPSHAESLATWEATLVTTRAAIDGPAAVFTNEDLTSLLNRGRALRAGIEALLVLACDASMGAFVWIPLTRTKVAVMHYEIAAWQAAEALIETRGNRR